MQQLYFKIKKFFNDTKLGHFIKSMFVTFTGIFIGILVLTPAYNAVFETNLPTIQEWKDLLPVVLDSFYRALWAMIMIQIGIYKYSSSTDEKLKNIIIPKK